MDCNSDGREAAGHKLVLMKHLYKDLQGPGNLIVFLTQFDQSDGGLHFFESYKSQLNVRHVPSTGRLCVHQLHSHTHLFACLQIHKHMHTYSTYMHVHTYIHACTSHTYVTTVYKHTYVATVYKHTYVTTVYRRSP